MTKNEYMIIDEILDNLETNQRHLCNRHCEVNAGNPEEQQRRIATAGIYVAAIHDARREIRAAFARRLTD